MKTSTPSENNWTPPNPDMVVETAPIETLRVENLSRHNWLPPKAARILLLHTQEDGTPVEVLADYTDKNGSDKASERSDDANDFVNPIYRGNHLKIDVPESSEEWLRLALAPNAHISESTLRRLWFGIKDRNKAIPAMINFLKSEPKRPVNMPIEVAQQLKPAASERGPSIYDFQIDIDKLELDPNNKVAKKDLKGRIPGSEGWIPTYGNRVTVEEIRDYLVHKHTSNAYNPLYEAYLSKPFSERVATGSSLMEKLAQEVRARALKFISSSYGDTTAWSLEKLVSEANDAALKEVQATTATGPDEILRLLMKYQRNANGDYEDVEGNILEGEPLLTRNKIVKKFKSDSSGYVQALAAYEFQKNPHQEYYKFFQKYMDLMTIELGYNYDRTIGAAIGTAYSHKSLGDVAKNSLFTRPVERDSQGNEIWIPVIESGKYVFVAEDGRTVRSDKVKGIGTLARPYYERVDIDKNGNSVTVNVPIQLEPVVTKEQDGVYRVQHAKDPNNPNADLMVPVELYVDQKGQKVPRDEIVDFGTPNAHRFITINGIKQKVLVDTSSVAETVYKKQKLLQLKVHKQPKYDTNRVEIGKLKLSSWVMEVGSRLGANQFAFEPAQMEDVLEKVIEIGLRMRRSYYVPGIQEARGSRPTRTRHHGKHIDIRKPFGRKSREFAEAQTALSFLWVGLNKLLTNGPADMDGKGDGFSAEALQQLAEQRKRAGVFTNPNSTMTYDPKMYAAGGMTNFILPEVAYLLQTLVDEFPAAKQPPHGDYFTLEQRM